MPIRSVLAPAAACLLSLSVALPTVTLAQAPTLVDPLRGLLEGRSSDDVFALAFEAQLGIPPDYADVVFWHSDTGDEIAYSEVRDLIGPARQDGALELLVMAEIMLGDQLPVGIERLARLLDAAYLASMRRPPEHVAVEFYDTRGGPTGDLAGGVSGHSPLNQQPPASADERIAGLRAQRQGDGSASGGTASGLSGPQSSDWPGVDLSELPSVDAEHDARFDEDRFEAVMSLENIPHDVDGVNWSGFVVSVPRMADLEQALEASWLPLQRQLEAHDQVELAVADPWPVVHGDQIYFNFVVIHAPVDAHEPAIEFRRQAEQLYQLEYNLNHYRSIGWQ